ncbi:MAG TPA: DMT family transporter [Leptolyngbyaceae cyanobacterium]
MSKLIDFNDFNSSKWISVGAMILSAACWGLATVMSKKVLDTLPPFTLLVIQLAASIIFLWLGVFINKQHLNVQWNLVKLSLTGILEPGLAYTFGVAGLLFTNASKASMIGTVEPILVILLAWLFLRERITIPLLILVGIASTGVILVIGVDINSARSGGLSLIGDLLIVLGTLCASVYVILSSRIVENVPPLLLAASQQSIGFIWAVLIWSTGILKGTALDLSTVDINVWILAIISGIVQYALAFWLYLTALKNLPAKIAALFLTLIPVFGVGGSYLFLNEKLVVSQLIGGILIMLAVFSVPFLKQDEI